MSAAGANNTKANSNKIIFTIKETKLYIPVVTLSANDNQKLSNFLSKRFSRSVYWNEYKTKCNKLQMNHNMANEYRYFHKPNFVGVNVLFAFVYSDQDDNSKRFNIQRHYSPKAIIKI